jgi:transposase
MEKQKSIKFSPEVRERAVRMVFEHRGEHDSQWKAIASIAAKIGCTGETLQTWIRKAEEDRGATLEYQHSGAGADQDASVF